MSKLDLQTINAQFVDKLRSQLDEYHATYHKQDSVTECKSLYDVDSTFKQMMNTYLFAESLWIERTTKLSSVKSDRDIELFIEEQSKLGPSVRARFDAHGYIVINEHGVWRSRYEAQSGFKLLDFNRQEAYYVHDHVLTREVLAMRLDQLREIVTETCDWLTIVHKLKTALLL